MNDRHRKQAKIEQGTDAVSRGPDGIAKDVNGTNDGHGNQGSEEGGCLFISPSSSASSFSLSPSSPSPSSLTKPSSPGESNRNAMKEKGESGTNDRHME
uniref:Uncharacterized protein n=1 Tax=Chromera velia CCMP2878 TaxID=1169474 RepID=A0A0G4FDS3_9ALVE|eukprot:Cvel_16503.t1-p1 / transcript=Cvel_16503.t1 / gene=Cvel_16503 / organism=Chromera_velia_CCMP2878 / gene_product=hypothetical protein / transcript_product=hypothetical protein / location=Cvel_scaffold1272:50263-50556(+) / protein_length=98 / sequence_SO=supercontig / SO=protein_coding / is_pseudo=false